METFTRTEPVALLAKRQALLDLRLRNAVMSDDVNEAQDMMLLGADPDSHYRGMTLRERAFKTENEAMQAVLFS